MEREAEDKTGRILSIFTRLKQGKIIYKMEESHEYGVAPRTIQRDIADIQCFLQEHATKTGEVQEIVFDKASGGYVLQTKMKTQLKEQEILAIVKILLESRALTKKELLPIIHKLVNLCSNESDMDMLEALIRNEEFHYVELKHGKLLLDTIWELEQAVKEQQYIEIEYAKLKRHEVVTRRVKPVGVIFSEFYFYLAAYIEGIDKEKAFENPDDIYPTIYRVDRLRSVRKQKEHFSVPYAERFEEGEYRKRVQFMRGGRLRKVKFKYSGEDIDAVLDRLPTAAVLKEEDGVYTVSAEVFGRGIDMWLRSQGELVEVL